MATISNNDIAQAIYLSSKENIHDEKFFAKVVQFLYKRKFLWKASDILSRLNKIINECEGRVVAKVWSARKLEARVNTELAQILTERYQAKEVNLIENLDEGLLGGFKIEVKDEVIDLTLKNKVRKLQAYLTRD